MRALKRWLRSSSPSVGAQLHPLDSAPRPMRASGVRGLGAVVALALVSCAPQRQIVAGVEIETGRSLRLDEAALTERSAPAVGVLRTDLGVGLAFVIDPAGVILTNRHVIEDSDHIVSFELPRASPPRRFEAVRVLYTDPHRDLALLEVDTDEALPHLPLATLDFEAPERYVQSADGALVFAPQGDGDDQLGSYRGSIASPRASVPAVEPGPFIELTHDIRSGQSGGPVIDRRGRAVGVVTWTWRDREGGYAVPIAEVSRMLAERPSLDDEAALEARAEARVRDYLRALGSAEMGTVRRMTSPTHAKEVRGRAVGTLLERSRGEDSPVTTYMAMLEQLVEATSADPKGAFDALQLLAAKMVEPEIANAMGLGDVPKPQLLSFYLELGQGYVGARLFGDADIRQALSRAFMRLQSLDAARSFVLAELITRVAAAPLELERVDVQPGVYGPRAVAILRVGGGEGPRPRLALQLKMEWGDWFVADLQPISG